MNSWMTPAGSPVLSTVSVPSPVVMSSRSLAASAPVMATVALLEKNPRPTEEQARKGLDGNICRCGTFVRILEAAMTAKVVARG